MYTAAAFMRIGITNIVLDFQKAGEKNDAIQCLLFSPQLQQYEYIKYSHAKAVTVFSDGYHNDVR